MIRLFLWRCVAAASFRNNTRQVLCNLNKAGIRHLNNCMRYIVLAIITLTVFAARAQRNLSGSIRHSGLKYIYKITKHEAELLAKSDMKSAGDQFLHTLTDSFPVIKKHPSLKEGNYLFVHAREEKIIYELYAESNIDIKLLANDHDISVVVHTISGQLVEDAIVRLGNRSMPFNKESRSYGAAKYKKARFITVDHRNVLHVFSTQIKKYPRPPITRKIAAAFPVKYVVRPLRSLFEPRLRYHNYFRSMTKTEQRFKSMFVFNKPLYKPGDTVKLKAFIHHKNGRLLNKPLIVRLSSRDFETDTVIATIHPYRPGGYEYAFALSGSFDLDLDDEYLVALEYTRSSKYDLRKYDGNLDDGAYAMKRKRVVKSTFRYEDYELKSVAFSARSDKKEHHRSDVLSVYLKAADENDLAVLDGRVQLLLLSAGNDPVGSVAPAAFLPDTLWSHAQPLEPLGETKITIPDSIFPPLNFSYQINCTFLNADNQIRQQTLFQSFKNDAQALSLDMEDDSLRITLRAVGKTTSASAMIYALSNGDTIERLQRTIPAVIAANPFATAYHVEAGSVKKIHSLAASYGKVSCRSARTKDSVIIQFLNPSRLPFWYTIFAGNKVIARGYGGTAIQKLRSTTPKNYSVSLQYLYGNKIIKGSYTIPYLDRLLTVNIQQPEFVYPGQTADITVQVSDQDGKPVAGADVTAYGLTKKFNASNPYVPYLGKIYPYRTRLPDPQVLMARSRMKAMQLQWQRWSRELRLDTIEYYRFTHPRGIYRNTEPAKDSLTQLAPFAVSDGAVLPVYLLYIDEKPVFFSQAEHLKRYSFAVREGKHSIRLRTRDKLIYIDSVEAARGRKTFLSVDVNAPANNVRIEKMPDSLTDAEKKLWSRYMILLEHNFDEQFAYIRQSGKQYLFTGYDPLVLTGPLANGSADLVVKNSFEQQFTAEGGWQYRISKGLVKQRQPNNFYPVHTRLPLQRAAYDLKDFVLTEPEIDSLWQDYLDNRSAQRQLFVQRSSKPGHGKLVIDLAPAPGGKLPFIKNIIVFRYNDPDFVHIYPGMARDLGYVEAGTYRILFLLKHDSYFIRDSVNIARHGVNYYRIAPAGEKPRDSVSATINGIIQSVSRGLQADRAAQIERIKETFNSSYLDPALFTETISGVVTSANGEPLAGATVMIKGTRMGTITNAGGFYTLRVPPEASIVITSVGFSSIEFRLNAGVTDYYHTMLQAELKLDEVIVTGYGKQRKAMAMSSVSISGNTLSGVVPGAFIRGESTMSPALPLIIVDGLPYSGSLQDLDPGLVANARTLDAETATKLYGARGAAGVIIITSKPAAPPAAFDQPVPANAIRRNFRDDAFWQPRLSTGADGKASFKVTFPDDITNWMTFAIAMGQKKQTGNSEGSIKSFKAISGNIALPQFAVAGDSLRVIGKALNYLPDSIQARRSFFVNDSLARASLIGLRNSWIDTFAVIAAGDSLSLKYLIQKNDGYADGEERKLPVMPQGVSETTGMFAALDKDTSFVIAGSADTGRLQIYAEASLLPVLYEEAERIRSYEYWCNEQIASKLKALLAQKKINQLLGRPFRRDKEIQELIKRLAQSSATTALWGWWSGNDVSMWISLHATEALLDAQEGGYAVAINKQRIIDYLTLTLDNCRGTEKLSGLFLLRRLGATADYKTYLDTIERRGVASLYERLRLTELQQQLGWKPAMDMLIAKQQHTVFGNVYWGEDGYRFFDNAVQNTLIMYRLLKQAGGHEALLKKIRNYFLEKKKSGYWRNTYESSLIISTILPDLVAERPAANPATLIIRGNETMRITSFPYEVQMGGNETLAVSKQGGMPVYFTAYRRYWNSAPDRVDGNFVVRSSFERNGQAVSMLRAGQPVTLEVRVEVKAAADYVMIEIPIPAGCSYYEKGQSLGGVEVHREYFKNKVSIFCSSLGRGEHRFSVMLQPRYAGMYHLNPARAELMYFPVFSGREGMKRVGIE